MEYLIVTCLLILQYPIHSRTENNVHVATARNENSKFIELWTRQAQGQNPRPLRADNDRCEEYCKKNNTRKSFKSRWPPEWRPTKLDAHPIPHMYDSNTDIYPVKQKLDFCFCFGGIMFPTRKPKTTKKTTTTKRKTTKAKTTTENSRRCRTPQGDYYDCTKPTSEAPKNRKCRTWVPNLPKCW